MIIKKESFKRVKTILLISNMYPSDQNPAYGIFIKNFEEQMYHEDFVSKKCVISGRGKNIFEKIKKYIGFFKQTINSIHHKEYDLIYVHYMSHSILPLLLVRSSILKPLVLNAHGSDILPQTTIGKLLQKVISPIIKRADLIVVPSEYFKSVVKNKFLFDEKKIFVSPSGGVDTRLFSKKDYFPGQKLTLGYVSRINKSKGWHIFLAALKLLKEKTNYNFAAIIIGDGPDMEQMKKRVESYGLSQEVSIVGTIEHKKLPDYYHKMDMFIFPTQAESLGLVGLEALSCGIPILGSDIFALKEYISPNINGNLFKTDDPMNLFTKINHFISLPVEKKKSLSDAARKTAQKYDASKTSHDLAIKLTQLIAKKEDYA